MADSGKKKHIVGKQWLDWVIKTFKDLRFRNQLYVFFICLLISVFIWLSIKLSKEYNTSVKHPVEYINQVQDKVLTNDPPDRVYLQVRGRGMELIKARIREPNEPLQINLSNVELEQISEHRFQSQVPSVWFLAQIARQSKYYDKLVDINPDTLRFEFEEIKYRKVPVKHRLKYDLGEQLWLRRPVSVIPDSIVISGIVSAVDTVSAVYTRKINLGTIEQAVSRNITLKSFKSPFLEKEEDKVMIKIPAEKYTESQVSIPIHAKTPRDTELKTFPEKVTITYRVSHADYEKVNSSLFRAVVNYKPESSQFLPVEIVHAPGYVEITEVEPQEIEYIFLQ